MGIHSLFMFCYCKKDGSEMVILQAPLSRERDQSPIISTWLLEGLSNSSLFLLMAVHKRNRQQVSKQFWKCSTLWSTQFLKMYSVWSWRFFSTSALTEMLLSSIMNLGFFLTDVTNAVAPSMLRRLLAIWGRKDIEPDMVRMRISCLAESML